MIFLSTLMHAYHKIIPLVGYLRFNYLKFSQDTMENPSEIMKAYMNVFPSFSNWRIQNRRGKGIRTKKKRGKNKKKRKRKILNYKQHRNFIRHAHYFYSPTNRSQLRKTKIKKKMRFVLSVNRLENNFAVKNLQPSFE